MQRFDEPVRLDEVGWREENCQDGTTLPVSKYEIGTRMTWWDGPGQALEVL